MGRRTLDNPQVQGDRPRRGKARPSDRRLRAIERRLDYLEAEVTTRREAAEQVNPVVADLEPVPLTAKEEFAARVLQRTGKFPPFLRPAPGLDALAWLFEDVRVPRGVLLGLAVALFGALLNMAARWWL